MITTIEIEILEKEIDIELNYRWDNDSMDYEFWGHKESIEGDDYPVIEEIKWNESEFTPEENEIIRKYVYSEEVIEKLDKKLADYIKFENEWR